MRQKMQAPTLNLDLNAPERLNAVISPDTLERVSLYKRLIAKGKAIPGEKLTAVLQQKTQTNNPEVIKNYVGRISDLTFINYLLATKVPRLCAEEIQTPESSG